METAKYRRPVMIGVLVGVATMAGCSDVRGRRRIQEGNQLYREGRYSEAVAKFEEAERFVPEFWLLWLNKGYTCRQMRVPGAHTPENDRATKCALDAFARLRELRPGDLRGPALYVQTLFDSEQYETLAKIYTQRFQANAKDEEAANGLIQVYSRWPNHMDDALDWYQKKADLRPGDAEAQYAVGVYVWQQLFAKGGGADKAGFDPRPDPTARSKQAKSPPPQGGGDIVSQQRVDLAETGIKFLKKALQLRPKYREALVYLNLLYRQESYAYFDQPAEWQKCVDRAAGWRDQTLVAAGSTQPVAAGAPSAGALDAVAPSAATPSTRQDLLTGRGAAARAKHSKGKRRK